MEDERESDDEQDVFALEGRTAPELQEQAIKTLDEAAADPAVSRGGWEGAAATQDVTPVASTSDRSVGSLHAAKPTAPMNSVFLLVRACCVSYLWFKCDERMSILFGLTSERLLQSAYSSFCELPRRIALVAVHTITRIYLCCM